jgi:hypothetical protein
MGNSGERGRAEHKPPQVATDGANLSGKPDRGVNVEADRVRLFLFWSPSW